MPRDKNNSEESAKKPIKWPRLAANIAVAVAIFGFGWAIGNGKIGVDSVFQRSLNKDLPKNLDYSSVEQVYDSLRSNYAGNLDLQKLLDGLKSGLVEGSGDPYSEFLSSEEAKKFNDQLSGSFSGIGAELSKDSKTGNIVVVSPIAGYPADKAGLRPKDVITAVDGQNIANSSISEAVNRIRGPVGTVVNLKILRNNTKELELKITRAKITIPSVKSKVLDGRNGYIQVSTFIDNTAELTRQAVERLKDQNVKGIVLDLRGNPGGLLDSAINISSLWLNNKVVLFEKRGSEVVKTFKSDSNPILQGVPTVVLIDEGSASASEIVAGALRDNGVAILIGKKSFGKGSVQQLINLGNGAQLKVTIAKWYTPDDKNIDKQGITPDKIVKFTDEDAKNNRDPQLDAALEFLKK